MIRRTVGVTAAMAARVAAVRRRSAMVERARPRPARGHPASIEADATGACGLRRCDRRHGEAIPTASRRIRSSRARGAETPFSDELVGGHLPDPFVGSGTTTRRWSAISRCETNRDHGHGRVCPNRRIAVLARGGDHPADDAPVLSSDNLILLQAGAAGDTRAGRSAQGGSDRRDPAAEGCPERAHRPAQPRAVARCGDPQW